MSIELTAEQLARLREVAERAKEYVGIASYTKAMAAQLDFREAFTPAVVLALLDELEQKDKKKSELKSYYEGVIADGSKRIAELEARTVALPKPQMVKYVSGEFIHCWPAYTVDSAIRDAGINLTVEG